VFQRNPFDFFNQNFGKRRPIFKILSPHDIFPGNFFNDYVEKTQSWAEEEPGEWIGV